MTEAHVDYSGAGSHFSDQQIAPVPRVSIQAFCETQGVASVIEGSSADRRMKKAHVKIHMGGANAAIEAFRSAPTPNLIVIENVGQRAQLLANLDELAEFCDAGTKVIVVGHENDIALYRALTARGVSDYLVAPFEVLDFVGHVSHLYAAPGATAV
ncbi:MAG TPA: CtpF protein, partial [Roseiarcus sp.]|nr:CtpF protein [Roseiarcus sp.]